MALGGLKMNYRNYNKVQILFFLFLLLQFSVLAQTPGKERWEIKTLKDIDSYSIDTSTLDVTIYDLRNIPRPEGINRNTERLPLEIQQFTVVCKIKYVRLEKDGDYHVVVCDTNDVNSEMIVEIIKPSYGSTRYYQQFKKVRDTFTYYKRNRKLINQIFEITGVGFFDLFHNQKGLAPNGIELHPVLRMRKL